MAREYIIENGPSREQLFDALRLWHENRSVLFWFEFDSGGAKPDLDGTHCSVKGISLEAGTGHSWNIVVNAGNDSADGAPKGELVGYYNTKTRKGVLKNK